MSVVKSVVELLLLVHKLVEKGFAQLSVSRLFCRPIVLQVFSHPSRLYQHYIFSLILLLMFYKMLQLLHSTEDGMLYSDGGRFRSGRLGF